MDKNNVLIVEISEVPDISVPNYEELLDRLNSEMEVYRDFVVTEDNIPEAKKVKANLNSLARQIEDERKRVKKIYEAPLKEFEAKAKTLSGTVKEVSDEIKFQLDRFEGVREAKKYIWCVEKWDEIGGETAKLIEYTKIHKQSWLNATTPVARIEDEMQSALRQIRSNIEMIRAMNVPEQERILGTYLRTLDINAALDERAKATEEQEKVEAVKASIPKVTVNASTPKVTFIPVDTGPDKKEDIPESYKRRQDIAFRIHNIDYIGFQIISDFLARGSYDAELIEGENIWQ